MNAKYNVRFVALAMSIRRRNVRTCSLHPRLDCAPACTILGMYHIPKRLLRIMSHYILGMPDRMLIWRWWTLGVVTILCDMMTWRFDWIWKSVIWSIHQVLTGWDLVEYHLFQQLYYFSVFDAYVNFIWCNRVI